MLVEAAREGEGVARMASAQVRLIADYHDLSRTGPREPDILDTFVSPRPPSASSTPSSSRRLVIMRGPFRPEFRGLAEKACSVNLFEPTNLLARKVSGAGGAKALGYV